jgi:hypothetical protein
MKLPVISGNEAVKAFRRSNTSQHAGQPYRPLSVPKEPSGQDGSATAPSGRGSVSVGHVGMGLTEPRPEEAVLTFTRSDYFFWHRGQKCVPLCATRILRIFEPQRGQGSPVF